MKIKSISFDLIAIP